MPQREAWEQATGYDLVKLHDGIKAANRSMNLSTIEEIKDAGEYWGFPCAPLTGEPEQPVFYFRPSGRTALIKRTVLKAPFQYLQNGVQLIHPAYVYLIKTGQAKGIHADEWAVVDLRLDLKDQKRVKGAKSFPLEDGPATGGWFKDTTKFDSLADDNALKRISQDATIKHVVFHCSQGISRSPLISAAYKKWADGRHVSAQTIYLMQGGFDAYAPMAEVLDGGRKDGVPLGTEP